ncbi:MAG: hypothetical protein J4G13_13720 [Dehalococcoidia bacterium]|nr:hypothetical protein [Dehalococcoidia bacterium]
MARHWITYSVGENRRRQRRGWGWRWRWPWSWRWPRRNRARVVRINRPRRTNDGERRRWPWLLLLLPLLLLLIIGGYLLVDDSEEETVADAGGGSGTLDPSAGSAGGPSLAGSNAAGGVGNDPAADDNGSVVLSIPDIPSIRLKSDATFMDLGDISCQQEQRYVLVSDGEAHAIDDLDDETMEVLARSDVPINTVAMGDGADTTALETIAARTGGTFTQME